MIRLGRTVLWLAGAALAQPAPVPAQDGTPPPNIIVLVADDLGWRDLGIAGHTGIRTPNIDRVAPPRLQDSYAFGTSPQCSPSRISILSGKYSHTTLTE